MVVPDHPRAVVALSQKKPNVVILVADDLGIGDLGCYGNHTINTPNIDKLSSEGVRLTHHLAAASLCTPSRAGLLTARYPARYGLAGEAGTPPVIVHVASRATLPTEEITLAKVLASANYTTAAVGKWHLGAMCGAFGTGCNGPQMHGFQHFYGLPFTLVDDVRGNHRFWIFSLDQPFYQGLLGTWISSILTLIAARVLLKWQKKSAVMLWMLITLMLACFWFLFTHYRFHTAQWWQVSLWMNQHLNGILMHNDKVTEQPLVLDGLTQNLVNFSIKFIEDHANDEHPFFLYHSFAHTHTPMFTAPNMAGRSKHGRYGDNVEEMDAGVGDIMEALARFDLDQNTLVYFVSDHGGHLESVDVDGQRIGGYNGLFKGSKGQGSSEGGIRVPGIYRWKDHLPSSVSIDTPTSLLDMMPTILDLVNIPPVGDLLPHLPRKDLDGVSIADLLLHGTPPPPRVLIHHCRQAIHALRWIQDDHVYKMYLMRHKFPTGSTQCGWGTDKLCPCYGDAVDDITLEPMLFDLILDPYEDQPIPSNTSQYRDVVEFLKQYLSEWRHDVHYPPSQYRVKADTILSPWLQPFCTQC